MLDRTIPFCNVIMRCDQYRRRENPLPDGYSFSDYREGFEKAWAHLEYAIGDFESEEQAEAYFADKYLRHLEQLRQNALFLLDAMQEVVGSCIAWEDVRQGAQVASLHWLLVAEHEQGKGLGRALCTATMNRFAEQGRLPVYLHTQPWSWKAICLYASLGFTMQKSDTFSHYANEYPKAMVALKACLSGEAFTLLDDTAEE